MKTQAHTETGITVGLIDAMLETKNLIESFGWEDTPWPDGSTWGAVNEIYLFKRDNYGLILDLSHRYKKDSFTIWVADMCKHNDFTGRDDSYLHISSLWLGEATLHALNTLLPPYTKKTGLGKPV